MATFMYLFRGGEPVSNASPQQMQAHMEKWGAWVQALSKEGVFKSGDPLESGGKVLRGTKKIVTDGPYAEAKDLVGGYLIVEVRDLATASEIAKGCPIFENDGTVEVRQIRPM